MIQAATCCGYEVSLTILCIGGHAAVRHCAAAVFLSTLLSPNLYLHFCSERPIYRPEPRRPGVVSYGGALYH